MAEKSAEVEHSAVHVVVKARRGIQQAVLAIAVLVELHQVAILDDHGKRRVRDDHVVEEIGDRLFLVVDSAADEEGRVVDVVLEVVRVPVVPRGGRIVQPVPLQSQFMERGVVLDRHTELDVGVLGKGRGGIRAVVLLVERQGDGHGVELPLDVLAIAGLIGGREILEAGVFEHRLGVPFQPLNRRQRTAIAGEHGLIVALPLRGQIGGGLIKAAGIGDPGVRSTGDGCAGAGAGKTGEPLNSARHSSVSKCRLAVRLTRRWRPKRKRDVFNVILFKKRANIGDSFR